MSNYRKKEVHESWNEILPNFNPNFQIHGKFPHSQNSFLDWCRSFGVEIDPANFSTLKTKPITAFIKVAILAWAAQRPYKVTPEEWVGDGEGLDGSQNTGR